MSKIPHLKQVNIVAKKGLTVDGEVYDAQKKIQVVVEEDSKYLLMYHHMIALVIGLNSLYDVKLMMWIGRNVNYNDNTVSLNKYYKKKVMEDVGGGKSTVEKSIASLVDKGFLVRDIECVRCAMYHVNPAYLWYGDTGTRTGVMQTTLELKQYHGLPDKEKGIVDDIKRYEQEYHRQAKKQKEEDEEKLGAKLKVKPVVKKKPETEPQEQAHETVLQNEIEEMYQEKDPEQVK